MKQTSLPMSPSSIVAKRSEPYEFHRAVVALRKAGFRVWRANRSVGNPSAMVNGQKCSRDRVIAMAKENGAPL